MNITLKDKYNYIMRYQNGENIKILFDEIKEHPSSNFSNIDQFINALKYWKIIYYKNDIVNRELILKYINKEIKDNKKLEIKIRKMKENDKNEWFENIDIKNYSKKELEQIIRIQRKIIKEYKKKNSSKPNKEIIFEIIRNEEQQKLLSIRKICELINFPRRTYQRWKSKGSTPYEKYNNNLLELIQKVFDEYKGVYGAVRIKEVLKHHHNTPRNIKTIRKYMKKLNLVSVIRKTKKPREYKNMNTDIPNLTNQNFTSNKSNKKWFIDESFIQVPEGYLYFCAIIDGYNNEIVSWTISTTKQMNIALKTLSKAIEKRNPKNVILHSDHGTIYTSNKFLEICKNNNIVQSMSRIGNSLDNRPIEYFFSILKHEYLWNMKFWKRDLDSLNNILPSWIYHYNHKRIQSNLGYKSPMDYNYFNISQ